MQRMLSVEKFSMNHSKIKMCDDVFLEAASWSRVMCLARGCRQSCLLAPSLLQDMLLDMNSRLRFFSEVPPIAEG